MEPDEDKKEKPNLIPDDTDEGKSPDLYEQEVWDEAIRVYNEFLFSSVRLF